MRKIILIGLFLLITCPLFAQCVGEIKDVIQDPIRGSIIVQTQYTLNGTVAQQGQTRYLETSGTNSEIIQLAKDDVAVHCENLIKRIEQNREYINTERLKIQKDLTTPIITDIKRDLVGIKTTKIEVIDSFKGKDIKVTYDSKNTVSDTAITP